MQNFSNWLIYPGAKFENDGIKNRNKAIKSKDIKNNYNRVLTELEKGRLDDLRIWARSFFQNSSLTYINWWNSPYEEKKVDVDIILKCQTLQKAKSKFVLTDHDF